MIKMKFIMNLQNQKVMDYTFVFVNALTGDVSAWNGSIGENLIKKRRLFSI